MLNLYKKQTAQNTPILKAASLIGSVTILLGMVCLVLDLTNPLWFWRILVFYNPTSVMSLGVMALLCYIPLVCILTLVALRDSFKLGFLDGIIGWFDNHRCGLCSDHLRLHGLPDQCTDPLPADQPGRAAGPLRGLRSFGRYRRRQDGCRRFVR